MLNSSDESQTKVIKSSICQPKAHFNYEHWQEYCLFVTLLLLALKHKKIKKSLHKE